MNDATERFPARLIDDYLVRTETRRPGTLSATALRTRSPSARHLLARGATRDLTLPELLQAARRGDAGTARVEGRGLCELARVVGLQFGGEADRRDALALYDLALELAGPKHIGPRHQAVHAQLALSLDEADRAAALLRRYRRRMPPLERGALEADLAHPDRGGDERAWIKRLGRLCGHPGLRLDPDRDLPRFDRLRADAPRTIADGPKITVVTSCFRPDQGLVTAVSSLLAGTWRHLEVLVVDDASGPEYAPVLDRVEALDDRVRVIRKSVNAGTFAARNTAYAEATGDFITGLDSDDWAAPARLEHSVAPLLADPELMLTYSDAFLFLEDLTVTRPGRVLTTPSTASMMIRRRPVLDRIGYLDEIRKGADTEYLQRAAAAFGRDRVLRMQGTCDTLMRQAPGSLSREEFGPGWKHPSRRAYQSAYPPWHRRVAAGKADPRLPAGGADPRPFWAPRQDRTPARRRFDVVFTLDWRPFGGPQKSTIEEIRALKADGLDLAVMHLESWRHMTTDDRVLCEPVQRLINDGVVDHVLPTEEVDCDLLVLRYPPILQYRTGERLAVRPRRMIVLANQAPAERDGSDLRYLPDACHANAAEMFGVEPLWVPQGPQVREALADFTATAPLAGFDMPGILDEAHIAPPRRGFRSLLPVVGRHSRDDLTKWPVAEDLFKVYPGDGRWDVRIMGGVKSVRRLTGEEAPAEWTCYNYNETDVDSFLYQLDFWIYFPHPRQYEAFGRAVLEALASGCAVVLPPRFEPTFGDAALYCEPAEVVDLVDAHYADPERFAARSALAQQRVRERFSHDSYRKLVTGLLSDSITA
ncbi:glycosyltransferase [Glycomyces xiaoerkulensis]|uniref:glycosyltransferase n=1 Tax=Glycomyces xiaoerkulensis TaxID=2038139 RepID=UPI0018E4B94C|nr:glycosyltransferase [Glycomyces xiaoerkulensis]